MTSNIGPYFDMYEIFVSIFIKVGLHWILQILQKAGIYQINVKAAALFFVTNTTVKGAKRNLFLTIQKFTLLTFSKMNTKKIVEKL